jgi:hypothetical protein
MIAIAPNGKRIIGRLEELSARAEITENSFYRDDDGNLDWDWTGHTEVFWDGQRPIKDEHGRDIFLDDEGNEWAEDQLTFTEEKEGG